MSYFHATGLPGRGCAFPDEDVPQRALHLALCRCDGRNGHRGETCVGAEVDSGP